jgi:hypothetical protein
LKEVIIVLTEKTVNNLTTELSNYTRLINTKRNFARKKKKNNKKNKLIYFDEKQNIKNFEFFKKKKKISINKF